MYKKENSKGEKFLKKHQFRIQLKMFILWKSDLPRILAKEIKDKYLQRSFFLKKMLRIWMKQLEEKRTQQKNIIKSEIIYKIIIAKRFFKKLLMFKDYQQKAKCIKSLIFMKNREKTLNNSLKKWSVIFKINRSKRIIEKQQDLQLSQAYFNILKKNYICKKTRKVHLLALSRFLTEKTKIRISNCFKTWGFQTKKKKRTQNVSYLIIFYSTLILGVTKLYYS